MPHCDSYSVPQAHCGSNYSNPSDSDRGWDGQTKSALTCAPLQPTCHTLETGCHAPSPHSCGSGFASVSVSTVALQDAARIGAGAQGQIGCSDNAMCGDSGSHHHAAPIVAAIDGMLTYGDVNNLAVALGNGAGDAVTLNLGDNNGLLAGNGDGDSLMLGTGNNNDLRACDGAGDTALIGTGDNNCLSVGNGAGDGVAVDSGNANALTTGNGDGDVATIGTGDNNLVSVGTGAGDFLDILTGGHNTLCAGNGAADDLFVMSGDHNFLHAGNGAGDVLSVSSGNFNALIAGGGAGDIVNVTSGDGNLMAVGDGIGDQLMLGAGNGNTMLDGNGSNDQILVGGVVGTVGGSISAGNNIVIGAGNGDQAWGSLGDGNNYMTGAGNDLVHTGGGNDFVYADNHTASATPSDPFHLIGTDSLAQTLFADSGSDVFAIQGPAQNNGPSDGGSSCGHADAAAASCHNDSHPVCANDPGLGTIVMTGHDANPNPGVTGPGAEKYWFSGLWGNSVITDFNSADGDRIMIGGVSDPSIANLGPVHFSYIHSAYDTANPGAVDLLINFGSASNTAPSITLIDFQPQDTGGAGGAEQFNNATFNNPQAAETALSHIFDFSLADNQTVTNHIAALAAQNLILH